MGRWGVYAIVAALLAPSALGAPGVLPPSVEFAITLGSHLAPSQRECHVWIPDDATMVDVLDAATGDCIESWSYSGGASVDCIDLLCGPWRTYIDEVRTGTALWRLRVAPDSHVEFVYAELVPPST